MENHSNANAAHFQTSRRDFLKMAGLAYMGLFASGCHQRKDAMTPPLPGFSGSCEQVAVAAVPRGSNPEAVLMAVKQTAEAASRFSWLSRGDTVFIKVASNSANPYPATTSPLSVRAMVRLLLEKGAGQVIVGDKPGVEAVYQDPDRRKGSSREVFLQNGLQEAALESGAQVHYFEEPGYDAFFADRTVHAGHWKGGLRFPNILNQVDHIVLLPRVSRHALAGTTLGAKAAVGWLRDDSRLELHHDAATFYEKIAEINDAAVLRDKQRLVLSVATEVQTTFGPDQGFSAQPDPGLVFASESLLAHDMVSLGWLLWNREHGTPSAQLRWFRDPYVTYPGMMNRIFVGMIWGIRSFFTAQTYAQVPIQSIRTDPVMVRAAALWGGFPQLELVDVNGTLPESVVHYLNEQE